MAAQRDFLNGWRARLIVTGFDFRQILCYYLFFKCPICRAERDKKKEKRDA